MRVMVSMLIILGQASWHSPYSVQPPNPSTSMRSTIRRARWSRSGWPWGRRPRWVTLAAVNSEAEPLGQAATQAPHPMCNRPSFWKIRSMS